MAKYNAKQLTSGKWAVFTGSKYFTDTVSDSKEYAEQQALIKSMQWYDEQKDLMWKKLIELRKGEAGSHSVTLLDIEGNPENGMYSETSQGDLLC